MALELPLNEQDKIAMDERLATLSELEEIIRVSERGGVPIGDLKAQTTQLRQDINKLRGAFFPGR